MISYATRLALTWFEESRKPRIGPLDEVVQTWRAWPWLTDTNQHVNNGQYLTLMDFGRFAWMVRSGLTRHAIGGGRHFVLGGISVTYRRPVDLLHPFSLHTRLVAWDERWFHIEHMIRLRDGRVATRAILRGMARRGSDVVPLADLLAKVGFHDPSPPLPEEFRAWIEASRGSLDAIRDADADLPPPGVRA